MKNYLSICTQRVLIIKVNASKDIFTVSEIFFSSPFILILNKNDERKIMKISYRIFFFSSFYMTIHIHIYTYVNVYTYIFE